MTALLLLMYCLIIAYVLLDQDLITPEIISIETSLLSVFISCVCDPLSRGEVYSRMNALPQASVLSDESPQPS